jgi:hypothetical protein
MGWLDLDIDGYTSDEISYHVKLLHDAGLLTAHDLTTMTELCWRPTSLTWQGHEFLDTVKNDTVWRKTKDFVKEKGGTISIEMLKLVATKIAAVHFGLG